MLSIKIYSLSMLLSLSIAICVALPSDEARSKSAPEAPAEEPSMALSRAQSFKDTVHNLASRLDSNEIDVPTFIKEFDTFYTNYIQFKTTFGKELGVTGYLNENVEPLFARLLTKYTNFSLN